MRILSFTFCAVVITCITVQATPVKQQDQQQQAAFDVPGIQNNYAWTEAPTPEELALKADQSAELISELSFRAAILDSLNREFQATGMDCESVKASVSTLIDGIIASTKSIDLPIVKTTSQFCITQLGLLKEMLLDPTDSTGLVTGLDATFSQLNTIFTVLQFVPLPLSVAPIINIIKEVMPVIRSAVQCSLDKSKLVITQGHCAPIADYYRLLVNDASNQPITPENASKEWKRTAAGTSLVLELSKNAIAKSNDELLSVRPIFPNDLISQYRDEYLRVADAEEARIYAQTYLGTIFGISNALEACLRVAADPAIAAQELQQDLDAQARFEDEYDEYHDTDDTDDSDDE
ncbi:hypothetical protein FBU30_004091 [Linnemannia zychae]|nr:hypothetical protein FBU30_004091 [Linnemannia zychae]